MKLSKILMTGVIVASLGTGSVALAAANHTKTNTATVSAKSSVHTHSQKFGRFNENGEHGFGMVKVAATALNIDQKTLINDLKSGKSLADIAASKGISKATLISSLTAAQKAGLDKAVSNGKLTADKETQILSMVSTRITKMVDHKGLPKMGFERNKGGFGLFKDVSTVLKVDQKTLINDLKSGKSLADIASSKGISKTTLISNLVAAQKAELDKAVSNGKLTAVKETQILSKANDRVTKMVDQKGLPKMGFKRGDHKWTSGKHGFKFNHSTNKKGADSSSNK